MNKKHLLFVICLGLVIIIIGVSCATDFGDRDFRQDMRDFVQDISSYGKTADAGFIIIPQNGQDLATEDGEPDGQPAVEYLSAIDGQGREDLYYGYNQDDQATPAEDREWMTGFLLIEEEAGVEVFVTDYCSTHSNMDDSYTQNQTHGFISFAADERDLNNIPAYPAAPHNVNTADILSLADAKNFLYLLDPGEYSSKTAYLDAFRATDYDLIIMDMFYEDGDGTVTALTSTEVATLKVKASGGAERLVICYMSIGEAEDYRYYWKDEWKTSKPQWLEKENPVWPGNFKVRYWEQEWQDIIFGSGEAYLDKIIAAGFDGVYLDIIDAFEDFE